MTLDIDHLRTWIGQEEVQTELLTAATIQRFNATFDRESSLDEGAIAPLLIHLCLAQPAVFTAELGPDGHPSRGGFLPPVPLPRRMWAGGHFTFHDHICIGELVRRRSVIQDVTVKEGRSGVLCFVTVMHDIQSSGRKVLTERQDIVYREVPLADTAHPKTAAASAPIGQHSRNIAATPMLLFRYSALTFNGHRIHYDAPFSTGKEGYPGLIVHGPMQATMLVQYAADIRNAAPAQFAFRSVSTIFDKADFTLNADDTADALNLWTAAVGGPVAMEATAQW